MLIMKTLSVLVKGVAVGMAVGVLTAPAVVFAGTAPAPIPEPTTLGIFAVASAGAAVAYRLFRRK
ncbi:MAG: hypothetical protein DCC73_07565 [Proteobacteria bacterium]|jgi:hypothetical protein|nr:MAG: hypothetical protein DCC73_07565 [Pseudomonadota bacterium]